MMRDTMTDIGYKDNIRMNDDGSFLQLTATSTGDSSTVNSAYSHATRTNDLVLLTQPTHRILDYPRHFFEVKKGKNPLTAKDAELLWQWRKDRPGPGQKETHPDGQKMLAEIDVIRRDLRNHIKTEFLKSLRKEAIKSDLKVPSTGAHPITHSQFRAAVTAMQLTDANAEIVHAVFHKFHHDRTWMSDRIDEWCKMNHMRILPCETGKKYEADRGGFTAVARLAKNEVVRDYMSKMFSSVGWCVKTKLVAKLDKSSLIVEEKTTKEGLLYYIARQPHFDGGSAGTKTTEERVSKICDTASRVQQFHSVVQNVVDKHLKAVSPSTLTGFLKDFKVATEAFVSDSSSQHVLESQAPIETIQRSSTHTCISDLTESTRLPLRDVADATLPDDNFDEVELMSDGLLDQLTEMFPQDQPRPCDDFIENMHVCAAGKECTKQYEPFSPTKHICPLCKKPVHGESCGIASTDANCKSPYEYSCYLCTVGSVNNDDESGKKGKTRLFHQMFQNTHSQRKISPLT